MVHLELHAYVSIILATLSRAEACTHFYNSKNFPCLESCQELKRFSKAALVKISMLLAL